MTHSKYIANKKNSLLNPQIKVILPQVKMLQDTYFFWNMKSPPINFEASVVTSTNNFFKIP